MMMFTVSMVEGIGADAKGQYHHTRFEYQVVNDIDTKQRQRRQE